MLAGRKLLLADDSLAVQKVVDLTFTDEGMQVTTVSDGRRLLDQLEQVAPDVVLADVFMPGVGGYEVCEFIKQSERFRKVPVMLLVGSFEPFDEAEARRAGADDVVTKPFQSIRELISRVGSLLGGKEAEAEAAAHEYSTLGLSHAEASTQPLEELPREPKVFVEAARMTDEVTSADEPLTIAPGADEAATIRDEAAAPVAMLTRLQTGAGDEGAHVPQATCSSDLELQTADTQQLEPIEVGSASAAAESTSLVSEDTIEIEPVVDSRASEAEAAEEKSLMEAPRMDEQMTPQMAQTSVADVLNDNVLDLGDDGKPSAVDEDFFLDLDLEEPVHETGAAHESHAVEAPLEAETLAVTAVAESSPEPSYEYEAAAETYQPSVPALSPMEVALPSVIEAPQSAAPMQEAKVGLSAEAVDAIARRVVEQLSEKVVREIAWEVVPELAELLIKQKLEEQQ